MRCNSYSASLLFLFLAVTGCQSTMPIGPSANNTVTHVVIMYLNDPSDVTARHEILAGAVKLEQVPGVINVAGGKMLPSDGPVVDTSYDVALVVTLKDPDALQKYLVNPIHVDLKKLTLDRYVKRYVVYDTVAE